MRYKLVAFDLDDTLAPSKGALPQAVAEVLDHLLAQVPVCVISGGTIEQFRTQLLEGLNVSDSSLEQLHLMPTCGTQYYRFVDGNWEQVYAHNLSEEDKTAAMESLAKHARNFGLWEEETWGPILEDRKSQITFSALGQRAPIEAKKAWDPTGEKKKKLAEAVARDLPGLEVRSGGSTSIDITAQGVDKAYGMTRLLDITGIAQEDMVFVGDRLDENGNDYPVRRAGWPCIAVSGWEETPSVVRELLS